ncbi:MAG: reverse transcriptase family protein [Chitinophagales bacterium]|jgi:RNA-directed DNA polymerase|nr:reverse transcriptase family protein [Sphingobacteriales bacterium]
MNSLEYQNSELKRLSYLLGVNSILLKEVLSNIDNYYTSRTEQKIDSKGNPKLYKNGDPKVRTISPSLKELKEIQRKINVRILSKIALPINIHGSVKGRSNMTNAKAHQGNTYQFTTDLQDFFPNISNKQVYNAFLFLKYSSYSASVLTKLTTWNNCVPQGARTSSYISNLIFYKVDNELIQLSKENNITYSRYIDDLTFSSQKDFKHLTPNISNILKSNGFKVNNRKTNYAKDQLITGIIVKRNKLELSDRHKEKVKFEQDFNLDLKPISNYERSVLKTKKLRA